MAQVHDPAPALHFPLYPAQAVRRPSSTQPCCSAVCLGSLLPSAALTYSLLPTKTTLGTTASWPPKILVKKAHRAPPDSREAEKGSSLTGDSKVTLQRGLWGWQYHLFPSWGTKLPHNLSLTSLLAHVTLQIASFSNFYMGKELIFMGFLPHVECRANHFHIGFLTDCDLYFQNDFPWT